MVNWSDEYDKYMKMYHKRRVSDRRKEFGVVWVAVLWYMYANVAYVELKSSDVLQHTLLIEMRQI